MRIDLWYRDPKEMFKAYITYEGVERCVYAFGIETLKKCSRHISRMRA